MVSVESIVSRKTETARNGSGETRALLKLQYTLAQILSEAQSEKEACAQMLSAICAALHWPWAAFWIERAGRLELIEFHRAEDRLLDEFAALSKSCHFGKGEGLPGRVWLEQAPIWISNVSEDAGMPRRHAAARCHLRAAAGFPVCGREFLGMIEFLHWDVLPADPAFLQMMEAVGAQIGQFLERKRAERALADSQSLFQAVFQSAQDAILLIDDQGRYLEANPAALKLLGLARNEIVQKRIWDVLPMGRDEQARQLWDSFVKTGAQEGDFTLKRQDGAPVEIEYCATAGIAPGVHLSVFRDVTERKAREERTRFLAEAGIILGEGLEFKAVLERVSRVGVPGFADACLVDLVNDDGQLESVETGAVESIEIGTKRPFPQELSRKLGSAKVARSGRAELMVAVGEAKKFGVTSAIKAPLKTQGRVFGVVTFLRASPRPPFAKSDIELAEELARRAGWALDHARLYEAAREELRLREKVDSALQKLNRELEQRIEERTAALQESHSQLEAFCYSVSHDLRAPLRSMQGFSHALLEDHSANLNEEGQDFARRILSAAEHMDGLLADVLAYSRLSRQELKPESVEINAVIDDVLVQLQAEIRRKAAKVEAGDCRRQVKAHRSVVELMLVNLLENALKFVPTGTIPMVSVCAEDRGAFNRIWVRDNGIGIPREHQQRIFRIFERLHGIETYPGSGIGLALVQKAAERMNGAVGVESTPGQGSAFWIDLPSSNGT